MMNPAVTFIALLVAAALTIGIGLWLHRRAQRRQALNLMIWAGALFVPTIAYVGVHSLLRVGTGGWEWLVMPLVSIWVIYTIHDWQPRLGLLGNFSGGRITRLTSPAAAERSVRIEPRRHMWQMSGKILVVVLLLSLLIITVVALVLILRTGAAFSAIAGGVALMSAANIALIVFAVLRGRSLLQSLRIRQRFLQNQAQTMAQIVQHRIAEHRDDYGTVSKIYHLGIEFTPLLASRSSNSVRVEAIVSRKIYERLEHCSSVQVTYAVDDPCIFIVEGE